MSPAEGESYALHSPPIVWSLISPTELRKDLRRQRPSAGPHLGLLTSRVGHVFFHTVCCVYLVHNLVHLAFSFLCIFSLSSQSSESHGFDCYVVFHRLMAH